MVCNLKSRETHVGTMFLQNPPTYPFVSNAIAIGLEAIANIFQQSESNDPKHEVPACPRNARQLATAEKELERITWRCDRLPVSQQN